MKRNEIIKDQLKSHIATSLQIFRQNPFSEQIHNHVYEFNNVTYVNHPDCTVFSDQKEWKENVIELLNDKELHNEIDSLYRRLTDINGKQAQDYIEDQLVNSLSKISSNILLNQNNYELNLLFLEHDYDYKACFCGFDDSNYSFRLLSGAEYLNYEYKKELFNGVGIFDYNPLFNPVIKIENELGSNEDKALVVGYYLEEIKKLYLLNAYLGIHICLERIKDLVKKINIPKREEVFIFGNEHDCEQLNIYVL